MPEDKRKLNAWIPISLYSQLETAGYDNITQALIKALEKFFGDTQDDITGYTQEIKGYKQDIKILTAENNKLKEDIIGYQKDIKGSNKDLERTQAEYKQDIAGYKEKIKILNSENERLKSVIQEAPDPIELAKLRTRSEEKDMQIEEKDRHIDTLKRDLEQAAKDKDDIKNLYDNYMRQMQTLIQQKAIEAPGEKKKPFWKFW